MNSKSELAYKCRAVTRLHWSVCHCGIQQSKKRRLVSLAKAKKENSKYKRNSKAAIRSGPDEQ